MDIHIKDIKVFGFIGVYEEEKTVGQEFLISVSFSLSEGLDLSTDNLDNTVDYSDMCDRISSYFTDKRCDLMETAAEELSCILLNTYDMMTELTLEIHKPNAEINVEFGDVYVSCTKKWEKVYMSLGSNMGDKDGYINNAVNALKEYDTIRNVRLSNIYTTKPYGNTDQDDFRNAVCELECICTPFELLDICNKIENDNGRVRDEHWGPRTLDIDIVLFGDRVINTDRLIIPHIDMHNRQFVLEPLCELAPGAVHPSLRKNVLSLFRDITDSD